jgi:uncharacterized protein YijF (DUF1287 family)
MRALLAAAFLVAPLAARAEAPSATELAFLARLAAAALERTSEKVIYDPTYFAISYPGGDVPKDRGVCTDVVIRSYRRLGIDLQKSVHEDMKAHFRKYPREYGLKRTDTNIDHRRVPNLRVFFARKGLSLTPTEQERDYLPGDLVTWTLPSGQGHIGIVTDQQSAIGGRPMVVHNIGEGDVLADVLFKWTVSGHYRYYGE